MMKQKRINEPRNTLSGITSATSKKKYASEVNSSVSRNSAKIKDNYIRDKVNFQITLKYSPINLD